MLDPQIAGPSNGNDRPSRKTQVHAYTGKELASYSLVGGWDSGFCLPMAPLGRANSALGLSMLLSMS